MIFIWHGNAFEHEFIEIFLHFIYFIFDIFVKYNSENYKTGKDNKGVEHSVRHRNSSELFQ